ncbi:ABC transporter substrate-binding protein [Rhodococcus erythropolis]|uniref:ABC transporter substrate-binding protein n=1 Tax=Rhodococcus erythropolis TaxID=1833 RepID=UPI0037AD3AE7
MVLATTLALSGCAGAATSASDNAVPNPDATVRFAISVPPTQMDPMLAPQEQSHTTYDLPIFDGLTGLDGEGNIIPLLAETWEESPDRLTWTFTLREGAVFHDRSPIDAVSVVANFDRAMGLRETQGVIRQKLAAWSRVEAVDPRTVKVTLDAPDPDLPAALASPNLVIGSPAAFATMATAPVGSGPFRFASKTADSVSYERFEQYWNPEAARAAKLEVRSIPDGTARMNALRSGEIDAGLATLDLATDVKSFQSDPSMQVVEKQTPNVFSLMLNTARPPVNDVRVRQALSYAINRQELNENLLGGMCTPTSQPIPNGDGHVADLDGAYPYDPAKAKELLAEAGVPNLELDANFAASGAGLSKVLAAPIAYQLESSGIRTNLTGTDPIQIRNLFRAGNATMSIEQMVAAVTPSIQVDAYLGLDNPGTVPPELRALGDAVAAAPFNSTESTTALENFNRYAVENPINIPICAVPTLFVGKAGITGLDDMPWITVSGNADIRGLGLAN